MLICIFVNPSQGDDTDLFTVRVDPNVLIIMDNSGSMNEVIYHSSYNPLTIYSGAYTNGSIYVFYYSSYEKIDFTANGRTAGLLYGPGDDGSGVRYNGNYLNWIFWHATETERNNLPQKTRIQVAREVLDRLIRETTGVRFGLMQFDTDTTDHGGMLLAECGATTATLLTGVSNLRARTWTPLSETMIEAWEYFTGSNNSFYRGATYNSPIQYYCQKNFIILITDGEPTRDWTFPSWVLPAIAGQYDPTLQPGNSNNPFYLDGVAWYLNQNDARNDLSGRQNVITYAIGFAIDHPLLNRTANMGGGLYFTAHNADQLMAELQKVIMDIADKSFSYTSPTVPAVRTQHENYVYLTSFEPTERPFWRGYLSAHHLNLNGSLGGEIWEANDQLRNLSSSNRRIYTFAGGSLTPFTSANISKEILGVSTDAEKDTLIAHIRGVDVYDIDPIDGISNVDRRWKLGDIFHSNPVIVGSPSKTYRDAGFSGPGGFYNEHRKRTRIIIAGANDGMLHAFNAGNWSESLGAHDEGTGMEEWAFIPPSLLGNLKSMVTNHTYFVDSSPKVADVWFYSSPTDTTKTKDEWKTVLICGLRKGGKHYFALDITDTKNPIFLWEFPNPSDPRITNYSGFLNETLGQSWSEPAIGKVKIEIGTELYERWVAFLGGGFDPSERRDRDATIGRGFYVIDIKTGCILKEFTGLSGMQSALAAPPSAVDLDGDGFIDKVYIGDLGGRLWVFDVSFNPTTKKSDSQWNGKILFQAPGASAEKHSIYYQPAVAFDRFRIPWVYFGTGDRENPHDTSNPPERFYAVMDDGLGPYPRTEEDLKDVTSVNTFTQDPAKKGWFIRLEKGDGRHEKVLARPAVFNRLVYFTTYSYKDFNDPCRVEGDARLYILEYLSGGGAFLVDDYTDFLKPPSHRYEVIGEGIPSPPVITVDHKGEAIVIVGTTSGEVFARKAFSPVTNKELLYWREVVR